MGRELGDLAVAQLQAWRGMALEWPVNVVKRDDGSYHLTCCVCNMTLMPVITINGIAYTLTHSITLAATVAHLRNVHRSIEREVYRDGNQNPETADSDRASSAGNSRTSDSGRL